ncbi:MAG: tetratricopeptide repeat protein [Desulfobacterales bacterium]|nr:tetratricopeptide repeat protein [Desulfobacterales bacterium]
MDGFSVNRGWPVIQWIGLGLCLVMLNTGCTPGPGVLDSGHGSAPSEDTAVDTSVDRGCAYFHFLWGKSAENDHRYEEALEAYEKLLLCDDGNIETMRTLATLLIKMDRNQEAMGWLRKVVKRKPGDIEARRLLAGLYAATGDDAAAVAEYRELLRIKEDEQALLMLASLYAREQKFAKARDLLDRLIRGGGDPSLGYYNLGRLYRRQHALPEAVAAYRKALELHWSAPLAVELAGLYEQLDRYDPAIRLYRRILAEDEGRESVRLRLINALLAADRTGQALTELRLLREVTANPEQVEISISRLLFARKKYAQAIEILSGLLADDPKRNSVRFFLALAYQENGDSSRARQLLALIPPAAREYEESVMTIVRILWGEEKREEAIRTLEKQVDDPALRRMGFSIMLATLYREEGRVDQARQVLDQALALFPDNADLQYEYGLFLDQIGDKEGAFARMEIVLGLDPENSAALNYIGYTWADQGIKLQQALEYIKKAVALSPADGYIRDSLGWVYFRLGDMERAVVELEKAVQMSGDDPLILEHLGDIYLRLDRRDDARAVFEKAEGLCQDRKMKARLRDKLEKLRQGR